MFFKQKDGKFDVYADHIIRYFWDSNIKVFLNKLQLYALNHLNSSQKNTCQTIVDLVIDLMMKIIECPNF